MKVFALLGRVLFGLIFILASPRHFSHEGVLDAVGHGVPLAGLLVPISGALALVGGISIVLGWRARWGAWLIVAFLIPITLWMHAFWTLRDVAAIHIQISMFFKNLAMLGAALYISYFGSGPMSIDEAFGSRSLKGRPRA